jgi:hypothetical protein
MFVLPQVVYSQFRTLVMNGQVRAVRFDDSSARIYFDLHHARQQAQQVQPAQRKQRQRQKQPEAQPVAGTRCDRS